MSISKNVTKIDILTSDKKNSSSLKMWFLNQPNTF